MPIIGLSGYAKSGKDTVASMIKIADVDHLLDRRMDLKERLDSIDPYINKRTKWVVKKFAGKLKEVATVLTGIKDWEDQDIKESIIPKWGMSRREFMQKLGTEAIRTGLHQNAWVISLMSEYKFGDHWIVTDVRFPNEAQAIKDNKGYIIRINKPGLRGVNNHVSETALDDWDFDLVIENKGDLNDLYQQVSTLLI